jgi:hypothetical protein
MPFFVNTETYTGTPAEVATREARLEAEGYRRSPSQSIKELNPGEYFTQEYRGSELSFQGAHRASITWCRE